MARLSPARRTALALVSTRRRRNGRIRDIARNDEGMARLEPLDRALAFRLAVGATAAAGVLDDVINARLKKPSSLEPRVRDAFQVAAYEVCYLDTPTMAAVSQGVELVRSVAPRAAGMANAVLRKLAAEVRPAVEVARGRMEAGTATPEELALAAALPLWLVKRVCDERGHAFAQGLCAAQMSAAPVYVAANGLRHSASELEEQLAQAGLAPEAVEGLEGTFVLHEPAGLAKTGLVEQVDLVVADLSAQRVCRMAAGVEGSSMLEIGQGRGTKSVLLSTALGIAHPAQIVAVDSVGSKVLISRERMAAAGLDERVSCIEMDACKLADDDLPKELADQFDVVFVDAPCSGTGTMRRHPELPSTLSADAISELAQLQLQILTAASARVAPGGTLVYSTCSVMHEEDEDVIEAFLASEAGSAFERATDDLLTTPLPIGGDGHFCARLVRQA